MRVSPDYAFYFHRASRGVSRDAGDRQLYVAIRKYSWTRLGRQRGSRRRAMERDGRLVPVRRLVFEETRRRRGERVAIGREPRWLTVTHTRARTRDRFGKRTENIRALRTSVTQNCPSIPISVIETD